MQFSKSIERLFLSLLFLTLLTPLGCGASGATVLSITRSLEITGLDVSATSLFVEHPLTVTVTVKSVDALTSLVVAVGLIEKTTGSLTDAQKATLFSCALGFVHINDIEAETPTSSTKEFIINEDCLQNGATTEYNLFAFIDPDNEIIETDPDSDDNNAIVYNEADLNETANQACTSSDGDVGCIHNVTVSANPGIDLSVASVNVESSVLILYPATDTADVPAGQEEYNFPHIQADIAIRLDGVDPSLTNGLPGDTEVRFDICPSTSDGDSCTTGDFMPLTIYSAVNKSSGHDRIDVISTLAGGHDSHISSDLYAEGDTLTALDTGGIWAALSTFVIRACINKARDAEPAFGLSAFTPLTEAPGESNTADNCKFSHVLLAIPRTLVKTLTNENEVVSIPIKNANTSGSSTSSVNFSVTKSDFWGSTKTIGISVSFSTDNTLDLSGAHSTTEAKAALEGWISTTLIDITGTANALVAIVGSGIDLEVSSFGDNVFSFSREIAELDYTKTWDISKSLCATFSYGIYIVSLDVEVCATGSLGFEAELSITAKSGAGTGVFASSTKIGDVAPVLKPFLDFDGSVSADVSIAIARAGVEATIAILDFSLPLTGSLEWGLISATELAIVANVKWDVVITTLKGDIVAFADVRSIKWCKKWFIHYPCGIDWDRVATVTIVSWKGDTFDYTILNKTKEITLTD